MITSIQVEVTVTKADQSIEMARTFDNFDGLNPLREGDALSIPIGERDAFLVVSSSCMALGRDPINVVVAAPKTATDAALLATMPSDDETTLRQQGWQISRFP